MMRRKKLFPATSKFLSTQFALVVILFSMTSQSSFSQVFKCGEVWSSEPCKSEGGKVKLPELSKSGGSDSYDSNAEEQVVDEDDTKKVSGSPSKCNPGEKNGVYLRFQDVDLVRTVYEKEEVTTISGRVKNVSPKGVGGGIYLKISPAMSESKVIRIARSISCEEVPSFTTTISSSRDLTLELLYSPVSRCDVGLFQAEQQGL